MFAPWRSTADPGCALGLVDDGELIFVAGYGVTDVQTCTPITPTSRFDIGSEAKKFTGASIGLLQEQGAISLSVPIGEILPELPGPFRSATVDQLLHHLSGIPDFYDACLLEDPCTIQTVYQYLCGLESLEFPSGTEFRYSNSGYVLLALIVQRVSGQARGAFVAERFFGPLNMGQSLVYDTPGMLIPSHAKGHVYENSLGCRLCHYPNFAVPGSGCLYSTVEDLARWHIALYTGALTGPALLERMLTPGFLPNRAEVKYGYGLDWGQCFDPPPGLRVITHSGGHGGSCAILLHLPHHRRSILLLCNNRRIPHTQLAMDLATRWGAGR